MNENLEEGLLYIIKNYIRNNNNPEHFQMKYLNNYLIVSIKRSSLPLEIRIEKLNHNRIYISELGYLCYNGNIGKYVLYERSIKKSFKFSYLFDIIDKEISYVIFLFDNRL